MQVAADSVQIWRCCQSECDCVLRDNFFLVNIAGCWGYTDVNESGVLFLMGKYRYGSDKGGCKPVQTM